VHDLLYRTYTYGTPGDHHAHAVMSISGSMTASYTYDANGNMATRTEILGTYTRNFDVENRLTSVIFGGQTTSFYYDADGNRILTVLPNGTKVYTPFPEYEKTVPTSGASTERSSYYLAGQLIAVWVKVGAGAGTLYYAFADQLGSVSAWTSPSGTLETNSLARYDPYGNYRTEPGTNANPDISDRGFTGHRMNNTGTNDLGLIYMNARYYLPEVGRFISADSIVPDPSNPQSYNRYTYALNSPINLTDPTGHRECSPQEEGYCRPLNRPPKVPGGAAILFEGDGWANDEQGTGTAAATVTGNAYARILNEQHYGWALTGEEALKLVHGGSITFTQTAQSCAQATGVATDDCWGRTTSSTSVEVYTNAGEDISGQHHFFVHEFAHTFEAAVGNSIPSIALGEAQTSNEDFPDRVAGANGVVANELWGFAGTRWEWQLSASPNANEELADMHLGWVYHQFGQTDSSQMRADFMSSNMPSWIDLAVSSQ